MTTAMLAVASCGGDDGGAGAGKGSGGGPCAPGSDSTMLVGTAMDPCPQDMCPDDPLVPNTDNDYITVATCPAAAAGAMSTWAQCQCKAKCGNGVKQAGEACDGMDLGGMTCMTMGKTGVLSCTAQCALNMAMCTTPPPQNTGGAGG